MCYLNIFPIFCGGGGGGGSGSYIFEIERLFLFTAMLLSCLNMQPLLSKEIEKTQFCPLSDSVCWAAISKGVDLHTERASRAQK